MREAFHDDGFLVIYGGDCRDVLSEMPAESVHCVVTSPPYWGLRDYGTATWDGGDPACDHRHETEHQKQGATSQRSGRSNTEAQRNENFRDVCGKCGATRIDSQLGLEPTPEEYVANMVAVFREVRRVLRADGTLWLNLGDTYARDSGKSPTVRHVDGRDKNFDPSKAGRPQASDYGAKAKDLVGIPWRVAFALQADGWYLRSDIIWAKPNPMPESVTDRPTKAHEYLFLLAKSARYYYDADAVREAVQDSTIERSAYGFREYNERDTTSRPTEAIARKALGLRSDAATATVARSIANGRNLRTVWTIATEPYPGAHFATFPRKLVEPCIKAGTSEKGVCPECGAPWVREVERESTAETLHDWRDRWPPTTPGHNTVQRGGVTVRVTTTGWRPSCAHGAEPASATVLDPFAGSGTTLLVAQALGRRGVGIDLNPEYLEMAVRRGSREFGRGRVTELAAGQPDKGLWALDDQQPS